MLYSMVCATRTMWSECFEVSSPLPFDRYDSLAHPTGAETRVVAAKPHARNQCQTDPQGSSLNCLMAMQMILYVVADDVAYATVVVAVVGVVVAVVAAVVADDAAVTVATDDDAAAVGIANAS